jgi:V8-like Glu-specific endopeptidase
MAAFKDEGFTFVGIERAVPATGPPTRRAPADAAAAAPRARTAGGKNAALSAVRAVPADPADPSNPDMLIYMAPHRAAVALAAKLLGPGATETPYGEGAGGGGAAATPPEAAAPAVVIGGDEREQVTSVTDMPWRTVGFLQYDNSGTPYACTATLITRSAVLTSGHCVHSGSTSGGFFNNWKFTPGRSGDSKPYKTVAGKGATTFKGWSQAGRSEYDV